MKKSLLLSCILILYSCSSSYKSFYADKSRYVKDMFLYYRNDSLRLAIDLPGDYLYGLDERGYKYNNEIEIKTFNKNSKIINKYFSTLDTKGENFLFRASTKNILKPYWYIYTYIFPDDTTVISSELPLIDSESYSKIYIKRDTRNNLYLFLSILDKTEHKTFRDKLHTTQDPDLIYDRTFTGDEYDPVVIQDPFNLARDGVGTNGNYLLALDKLKDKASNYTSDFQLEWLYTQALITYNSFLTNNEDYKRISTNLYDNKKVNTPQISVFDGLVIDSIVKIARNNQVVMINEQHWQPKHRYLGNMLLSKFYDEDFRYLAVEAIHENDDSLNLRKYPIQSTGAYTKDPQMANMLRNAMNMGYRIVSYDYWNEMGAREHSQAKNIYNKTIKKDKNAKVLVWAGIGHIDEKQSDNLWMAYHFREQFGIDPFTIDQVEGDSNESLANKHYLAINDNSLSHRKMCDLFLYNDIKETDFKIKPNSKDEIREISISQKVNDKIKQHKQLSFSVFNKNEFDKHEFAAVPMINRLVKDNSSFKIPLPDGEYYLIFRSPSSAVIEQTQVEIEKK